jgi:hypothetical protein
MLERFGESLLFAMKLLAKEEALAISTDLEKLNSVKTTISSKEIKNLI